MEKIQEVVLIAKKRHISYDKALVIYNKQQASVQAAPVAKVSEKPVAKVEAPSVKAVAGASLYDQLVEKMQAGPVRFTHVNRKGAVVTNVGTLNPDRIGKRKLAKAGERFAGIKVSKKETVGTYFDLIHGMYRPVIKANVQAIIG